MVRLYHGFFKKWYPQRLPLFFLGHHVHCPPRCCEMSRKKNAHSSALLETHPACIRVIQSSEQISSLLKNIDNKKAIKQWNVKELLGWESRRRGNYLFLWSSPSTCLSFSLRPWWGGRNHNKKQAEGFPLFGCLPRWFLGVPRYSISCILWLRRALLETGLQTRDALKLILNVLVSKRKDNSKRDYRSGILTSLTSVSKNDLLQTKCNLYCIPIS